MILLILAISLITVAITLSCLAMAFAARAIIDVKAMKASTHNIQYVPVDQNIEKANEEYLATQSKFNKEYSDELEETMPMFHKGDDDLEIKGL